MDADPTEDSDPVSESSRRCRSLCKRAMPRPREDVVDPTAVLPLPAVPSAVPGDEVLEEDEVCLPDFVILAWRERAGGRKGKGWRREAGGNWGRERGGGDVARSINASRMMIGGKTKRKLSEKRGVYSANSSLFNLLLWSPC